MSLVRVNRTDDRCIRLRGIGRGVRPYQIGLALAAVSQVNAAVAGGQLGDPDVAKVVGRGVCWSRSLLVAEFVGRGVVGRGVCWSRTASRLVPWPARCRTRGPVAPDRRQVRTMVQMRLEMTARPTRSSSAVAATSSAWPAAWSTSTSSSRCRRSIVSASARTRRAGATPATGRSPRSRSVQPNRPATSWSAARAHPETGRPPR
jgi:hypothetical protein